MIEDVQKSLHAYYTHTFPQKQNIQITNLSSITTGWENEMYSFDMEYNLDGKRQCEALVLRIYPGDNAYAKSIREFHGMRRLHKAGYPVPQVMLLERENSPFGKPFLIMARIDGEIMGDMLFNSSEKKQQELLTRFCKLLVQLHRLDWRPFAEDVARYEDGVPYFFVDQWLSQTYRSLARFPLQGFLPIVKWLEERRDQVPCPQPSVIHWDFHPWNILVHPDGSAFVIDWASLNVMDSRFDLAWTLVLANSHIGPTWRSRILQEYTRLTGVDVEQIEWFEVCGCIRRLLNVTVSLSMGAEKQGMRPDAVKMMKQHIGAIENVHNLLFDRTGIRVPEVERLLSSDSS